MKKRLIDGLLCVLVLSAMILGAAAQELPLVVDEAGILSRSEEALLEEKAADLRQIYGFDVVILTLPDMGGQQAMDVAADYYDYSGYGTDQQRSGTLLLLAMDEREWFIDTSGKVIYALTDYGLYQQEQLILPYLKNGEYYEAFDAWLDSLYIYFEAYQEGAPIDGDVPAEDRYYGNTDDVYYYEENTGINWFIPIVVGLAVGAVSVAVMWRTMNTRRKQDSAEAYLQEDSYEMPVLRDVFLYSNVTKTRKQSSSGGGGGSSVRSSSSGRSHGGRGGKF